MNYVLLFPLIIDSLPRELKLFYLSIILAFDLIEREQSLFNLSKHDIHGSRAA